MGVVKKTAGVRRRGEVVFGSAPDLFVLDPEPAERFALSTEAVEHTLFFAALAKGEVEFADALGSPGIAIPARMEKTAHLDIAAEWASVIRAEFPNLCNGRGAMNRECGRIVIGVAAFVGMREYNLRREFRKETRESAGQFDEMRGGFLIGDANPDAALLRNSSDVRGGEQFGATRLRVTLPVRAGPGSSISHVDKSHIAHRRKLTAEPDSFIVRMRGHNDNTAVKHSGESSRRRNRRILRRAAAGLCDADASRDLQA